MKPPSRTGPRMADPTSDVAHEDVAAAQSADALFVLQIIIDTVHLHRHCVDADDLAWVRLGFQLLSFNVVVLDAEIPLTIADGNGDELTGHVRKGKSCMFRMQANALMDAMDANPLSLMLLEPPKAAAGHLSRLLAFTCIDMPRRERFHHDAATMREWVNLQSSWTMYNHAGDAVGLVQGGVVLSHLGTSLAPHLQHALAIHVTDVSTESVEVGGNHPPPISSGVDAMTEPMPKEKVDTGVQCEAESNPVERAEISCFVKPASVIIEEAVDEDDDVFASRRPPPLFFQAGAPSSPKELKQVTFTKTSSCLLFKRD
ncbi:hypothetical protein, variant 1 [Aphanomyces invadans]|uniref:Uncharacterized protein n=1 Tax=Aphanomyces invadans TaxID=157072 RepID=A0A024TRZ5_9STRA|nr:hypothetical protein, variant 1 [Aphanomyces invadans]ETV96798.1 hypothetical protein, variant 1 [Aphanomyces invadans]|eukprot:XP_008874574.1 hypothetical protein, variant 1 [Aphanomyces invadans]